MSSEAWAAREAAEVPMDRCWQTTRESSGSGPIEAVSMVVHVPALALHFVHGRSIAGVITSWLEPRGLVTISLDLCPACPIEQLIEGIK